MASTGVVWDRWTSPIDRPSGLINRWLVESQDVIERFQKRGDTVFVTDDQQLDLPGDAYGFSSLIRLEPDSPVMPAQAIEDTSLAQSFATAIQAIGPNTSFIWLHSSALRDRWDAPIDQEPTADGMQEPVEDEEAESDVDPAEPFCLPETIAPPNLKLASDDDPDLLFAWMNRYAAQIRVLDQLVELMVDELQSRRQTILLAGSSGFSIGENGYIGHHLGPLRSPDVRLPMLVSSGGPLRSQLLQSATGLPKLLERIIGRKTIVSPSEWCRSEDALSPQMLTESDRASRAVTTPTWFYVNEKSDQYTDVERLFLKPDDVNDINDVSRLRRDVLDDLAGDRGPA